MIAIGIITYNDSTAKYLPYFLDSLQIQAIGDHKIYIIDNSDQEENENKRIVDPSTSSGQAEPGKYSEIDFEWAGGNLGFAKAYNKMIHKAVSAGAKYFLAINPDMLLENGAVAEMVQAMDKNFELGSVCPKILKWDFENKKKTNIIDSCGIKIKSGLRFFDVGQGEEDHGQYDHENILGPSGAAALYRISALEKAKEGSNYFDELMFMYKEDCDLAYRLSLARYKSKCVPEAIVYHDRTGAGVGERDMVIAMNRKNKSKQVKEWSFLNQQIIFLKYWQKQDLYNKLSIVFYKLKMLIYILLFEQYLLKQFGVLKEMRSKIKYYK